MKTKFRVRALVLVQNADQRPDGVRAIQSRLNARRLVHRIYDEEYLAGPQPC